MALWASLSFARFLANWSGVRLATPREPVPEARRFLPEVDPLETDSAGDGAGGLTLERGLLSREALSDGIKACKLSDPKQWFTSRMPARISCSFSSERGWVVSG